MSSRDIALVLVGFDLAALTAVVSALVGLRLVAAVGYFRPRSGSKRFARMPYILSPSARIRPARGARARGASSPSVDTVPIIPALPDSPAALHTPSPSR